jgi:hypothetical protein
MNNRTAWTFAITSIALFMVTLDNLVVTTVVRVLAGVLPRDRASWRLAHGAAGASG